MTKEKVQKYKQRSTKHSHKAKDRVTRIPLNRGDELRCSRRASSSCSISGNRRVNLVTNSVTTHSPSKVIQLLDTITVLLLTCLEEN